MVCFADDHPDVRFSWFSAAHDEEKRQVEGNVHARKSQSLTGLCGWAILYRVSHGKHGRCIVCLSVCVAENLPRKRTAGSDLTLAQAFLVALLGVSSKARVAKWARAWKNLDKEIKDDLSRWVSGAADHFNSAVIQTQCAA